MVQQFYEIEVTASYGKLKFSKTFILNVNVGEMRAPTDLTLSDRSIEENRKIGTVVGTFTTEDPNVRDFHTYKLVSGLGGEDNAKFQIYYYYLLTTEEFNYELKNIYNIKVRTTDEHGDFFEKTFKILVNDVNEPPTSLFFQQFLVEENSTVGTVIG